LCQPNSGGVSWGKGLVDGRTVATNIGAASMVDDEAADADFSK